MLRHRSFHKCYKCIFKKIIMYPWLDIRSQRHLPIRHVRNIFWLPEDQKCTFAIYMQKCHIWPAFHLHIRKISTGVLYLCCYHFYFLNQSSLNMSDCLKLHKLTVFDLGTNQKYIRFSGNLRSLVVFLTPAQKGNIQAGSIYSPGIKATLNVNPCELL